MDGKEILNKIRETMHYHEEGLAKKYIKAKEDYLKIFKEYDTYLECEKKVLKKYLDYIDAESVCNEKAKAKIVEEANLEYNKAEDIIKNVM